MTINASSMGNSWIKPFAFFFVDLVVHLRYTKTNGWLQVLILLLLVSVSMEGSAVWSFSTGEQKWMHIDQ